MSQQQPSVTPLKPVTLYDSHRPKLESGTYEATFQQQITVNSVIEETLTQNVAFHIAGPRFNLPASSVRSVDPASGAQGNYMADLPKLVLERITLPWERSPGGPGPGTDGTYPNSASWLFLLLVDESEMGNIKEYNSAELSGDATSATLKQGLNTIGTVDNLGGDLDFHQNKFNALLADQSFVKDIIPTSLDDLQYLSYASIKEGEEEHGVILCNRLPKPGSNSTVYLISVENNYSSDGNTYNGLPLTPTEDTAKQNFYPYFYKWSFHSNMDYMVTADIMKNLSNDTSNKGITFADLTSVYDTLFTSYDEFSNNKAVNKLSSEALPLVKKAAQLPGVTFHGLLSNLTGGFKALTMASQGSKDITSIGAINLPFKEVTKKAGDNVPNVSSAFYHGPLVAAPITIPASTGFPVKIANDSKSNPIPWHMQLKGTDVFFAGPSEDASYGVALELGRLVAMNNVSFAEKFIAWKTQAAVTLYQAGKTHPGLTIYQRTAEDIILPTELQQQFTDWSLLKGIPYQHLIPDPKMLPIESLRYFYLDTNWINAFLYGAFSIGHTIQPELLKPVLNDILIESSANYQGFLLNSFAVTGWPDFEVKAFQKAGKKQTQLTSDDLYIHRKNLSKNIVMQVYNQPFDQLQFELHHSKVHSGFLYENEKYEKEGHDISNMTITNKAITNISQLATDLGTSGSVSAFAAAMLEGTPYVQFNITS